MSLVRAAIVMTFACGLSVSALADPIRITSDRRYIDVQGGAELGGTNIGDSNADLQSARDSLSGIINIQAGPLTGSASASLVSSIADPARLYGTAVASATSFDPGPAGNGNSIGLLADNTFQVLFTLTEPYRYTFASAFTSTTAVGATGSHSSASTPYFATLQVAPWNQHIFDLNASTSRSFLQTGNLAPGDYWLFVHNRNSVGGSASLRSGFDFTFNLDPSTATPTPEPASLLLLGSALGGLAVLRRRGAATR